MIVELSDFVVEILHNRGDYKHPDWSVGSGFFVGTNLVLTALHNVDGQGELLVRIHGKEEYPAIVSLPTDKNHKDMDLAMLTVSDMAVDVPSLRYGIVDRSAPAMVKHCWAIGFPNFKKLKQERGKPRPPPSSAHVNGEIPTGEYLGQQLLTLQVRTTPLPQPQGSEWAGMSGAVVFSDSYIVVGVITEHHLPEGESALAVVPITAIDDLPSAEAAEWWQLLGVDRQALVRLPDEEPSLRSHLEQYKQQQTLLADKTRDFVGRQHVFEKIEKFFKDQDSGYLLIEGDPGIGKSSILAEYVRRTGCIAHFNVRGQGIVKMSQFLENVCSQLIVNYRLPYPSLPAKATQDGMFLGKLLQEASEKLQSGERLVIAVDALDEIDPNSQLGCSNCLCLPSRLPNGVYFVMTTRPRVDYVRLEALQELLDLMQFPAENRRDVEQYIVRRTKQPKVQSWIEQQKNLTVQFFVKKLAELSKDNFMYLSYVLGDIEKGKYQDLSIEKLPVGLEGYYEDHWKRMDMTAHSLKILTMYILSETPDPISLNMICSIFEYNKYNIDALELQSILSEWGQFLHEQPVPEGKRYSIYHSSFRDFLNRRDIVRAAGVTIKEIKYLFAEYFKIELYGNERDKT
jgi:hypothetical protein